MTNNIGCTPSSETRRVSDGLYKSFALVNAIDPDSSDPLHTKLEPTRTNGIADQFVAERREKHDVDGAIFLVDGAVSLHQACENYGLDFSYERHGHRNSVKRVFREVKRRTICFLNCFSNAEADTADEWLRSFAFAWNQRI